MLIVRESSGRDKEENIGQAERKLKGYFKKSGNVHKNLCMERRNVKGKNIGPREGNYLELEMGSQHSNCAESRRRRQELGYVSEKSWVYFNY